MSGYVGLRWVGAKWVGEWVRWVGWFAGWERSLETLMDE